MKPFKTAVIFRVANPQKRRDALEAVVVGASVRPELVRHGSRGGKRDELSRGGEGWSASLPGLLGHHDWSGSHRGRRMGLVAIFPPASEWVRPHRHRHVAARHSQLKNRNFEKFENADISQETEKGKLTGEQLHNLPAFAQSHDH